MSGDNPWDIIGGTIGGVLGTAILGPAGGVLGSVLGGAPSERTVEGHPVAASAPDAPRPAPAPPDAGAAADASAEHAKAVAAIMDHLKELDDSASSTVDAIHSAGAAGQKALDDIQKDVDAKITGLGPRLNTPDGQKELREFLKDKLASAKQIIDEQMADAEAKANHTRKMTQHYLDIAGGGDKDSKDDGDQGKKDVTSAGDPGGGGGSGGSGSGGADPGTSPAAAPGAQPAASPYGPGGMPGAAMMPAGFPGMPSLGGGMPGLGGGGDPFGGLSGLGGANAHGQDPGFQDGSDHQDSDPAKLHDAGDKSTDPDGGHDGDGSTKPAADQGPDGHAEPAANATTPAADAGGTHVALPDGTSSDARTTQGAAATRAALGGAPVADAWQQAGVAVPPPGTPVTEPIPPTKLQAGDIGVWQDHLVMALGNGKVLVSGQEQPLESLSTGSDFLGWMDPSAGVGKGAIHGAATVPPPGQQPPTQSS